VKTAISNIAWNVTDDERIARLMLEADVRGV
jgi:hypothetical protein